MERATRRDPGTPTWLHRRVPAALRAAACLVFLLTLSADRAAALRVEECVVLRGATRKEEEQRERAACAKEERHPGYRIRAVSRPSPGASRDMHESGMRRAPSGARERPDP